VADQDSQKHADETLADVAFRGEGWWFAPDNSMRIAVEKLAIPQSLKLWIGDVASQAWTEGAITAVWEYGDQMRAAGWNTRPPPKVKPLVFNCHDRIDDFWFVHDFPYSIRCEQGPRYMVDFDGITLPGARGGGHAQLEAAKAAAQADYERRIRDALE